MYFECLNNTPKDYISDLTLIDDTLNVIVTAWDGTLTLYACDANEQLLTMKHDHGLLCSTSSSGGRIFVGSVQGEVLEVDMESGKFRLVCDDSQLGVCAISTAGNHLVAGSWDGSIQVIDLKTGKVWYNKKFEDRKVLALDCNESKIVVAYTGGKLAVYDVKNMNIPVVRDSGLKFQCRDLKIMPSGDGYAQSSVDGRVAIEYFEDESSRFAFRCHRMNLSDTQFVFPVNTLAFSSREHLYTGGSDGRVFGWNLKTRKKSEELPKFDESVVRVVTNKKVLCVATADDSFKTSATVQGVEISPGQIYFTKL
ncbi:LADA_0G01156g1_1 [Lachancea dasiensis]|uniref:LADA_0G01156g1_1 n=1 Tax=Lachancea dasiensis TaxID=1072105 RepID=A0A1G4JQZ0_9SACH|nr:LADA_0G01156g1_1 [Lachancea dasiensis]